MGLLVFYFFEFFVGLPINVGKCVGHPHFFILFSRIRPPCLFTLHISRWRSTGCLYIRTTLVSPTRNLSFRDVLFFSFESSRIFSIEINENREKEIPTRAHRSVSNITIKAELHSHILTQVNTKEVIIQLRNLINIYVYI